MQDRETLMNRITIYPFETPFHAKGVVVEKANMYIKQTTSAVCMCDEAVRAQLNGV